MLLNEPGAASITLNFTEEYFRVDNTKVTSITLGAAQAAILRYSVSSTSSTTSPSTISSEAPTATFFLPLFLSALAIFQLGQ